MVAMVLRCAGTDREVATGIMTDLAQLYRLGDSDAVLLCQHHRWSRDDVYLSLTLNHHPDEATTTTEANRVRLDIAHRNETSLTRLPIDGHHRPAIRRPRFFLPGISSRRIALLSVFGLERGLM